MPKKNIFLLILAITASHLYSIDIQITGKEVGLYINSEYNRAFNFCWDVSTVGAIRFNEQYTVRNGLALGTAGDVFEVKGFAFFDASLPVRIPLYVSLGYNYNGMPEYESHAHSIMPLVSIKGRWIGISLGSNFRFTSFMGEPAIFEPIPSALVYVNFINNKYMQFGLSVANFNDFTWGNLSTYFLNMNGIVRLSKNLFLVNEVELHQSGSIALALNFYEIVYRGGILFSW